MSRSAAPQVLAALFSAFGYLPLFHAAAAEVAHAAAQLERGAGLS